MTYLSRRPEHKVADIVSFFSRAGFKHDLIAEALDCIAKYHFLHFENSDIVNPHRRVIDAYGKLINEPAAMDNFAITTPVPDHCITPAWKLTRGYSPSQFFDRCRTTISFIKCLYNEESKIERNQHKEMSVDEFRSIIPNFSGQMRLHYNDRLVALRDMGWPAQAAMSKDRWDE